MHPARWHLRLLGLRLARPVGDIPQATTSGRPPSRPPTAGRWRQSRISSRRGSQCPSVRRAASPTGHPPSRTSRPSMLPASFIVARSRPTTPLGSVIGSPGLLREMASYLLRLSARRLLRPSSQRPGQLAPFKMSIPQSMEPMSCSLVWPTIGAADGNNSKRCTQ